MYGWVVSTGIQYLLISQEVVRRACHPRLLVVICVGRAGNQLQWETGLP